MELIVISESKLKIMLSEADMVKYELEEDAVLKISAISHHELFCSFL